MSNSNQHLKQKYHDFSDRVYNKRYMSPFAQRRYVHRQIYNSFLKFIKPRMLVADIGAGEGVLSMLMAKKKAKVVALEISQSNIKEAKKLAEMKGVENLIDFVLADAENPPFKDNSFDLVVSSHVLEHLPDFDKGLLELKRITKKRVIFAIPTCLNWCAIPLLGGGNFWTLSFFTVLHLIKGIFKILINIFTEGVNDNYAGMDFPHIWRYPWKAIQRINKSKLKIKSIEASTLVPPYLLTYFDFLLQVYRIIDKTNKFPLLKYLGYGTTFEVEKT